MGGRWLPSLSVASWFTRHCYKILYYQRISLCYPQTFSPLSFSLFYLAFHRFVVTDLFLHLHGLILHPSIYYWQDQPDFYLDKLETISRSLQVLTWGFLKFSQTKCCFSRYALAHFFPMSPQPFSLYLILSSCSPRLLVIRTFLSLSIHFISFLISFFFFS